MNQLLSFQVLEYYTINNIRQLHCLVILAISREQALEIIRTKKLLPDWLFEDSHLSQISDRIYESNESYIVREC
jgi:hypothetical protein